ncbi:hypothetical protein GCM10023077_05620 [Mycolicibacterium helvum]
MFRNVYAARFGALVVVLGILFGMAPPASADPEGTDPVGVAGALVDSPTLSLIDLGSTATGSFFSSSQGTTVSTLTFPVPQGLAPVALDATIEIPIELRYASMAVTQNGRTVSRFGLPLTDQARFVIPLAGAEVVGNSVTVSLTVTAEPIEGYCWDIQNPLRLVDGMVAFTGAEVAPTTVAGFLPPVLRKLTIALPATPSQSESNAAIQLAAAIQRRYGSQNPGVVVVPLGDPTSTVLGPSMPLERQIIIKEGPTKGLSLQPSATNMPALLVSGRGDELANQVRLLGDALLQYALSPDTVVTGPLPDPQDFLGDSTTLTQLKQTGLSSLGLWPEVAIDMSQARFGHSLGSVRVHLIGSHTPIPNNFGGEVTAMVGEETVGRWPVEASGTIDHWVDIPAGSLTRITTLRVAVHTTTADAGRCGNYVPMILRIDGSTQIVTSPTTPSVSLGFGSLPQALMPRIQIGLSDDAFGDTVRATQIIAGLQHMSAVPLNTTVVSLKQAIDSHQAAILISAGGWPVPTITAPFDAKQNNVTVWGTDPAHKAATLTLNPTTRFGSLQTVFDGQRPILIATSNAAPEQLDELLRWLSAKPERWDGLSGQAVVSTPGSEPITVSNPSVGVAALPGAPSTGRAGVWAWWLAGGLVAVAVAGGLILLIGARRRPRSSSEPVE